MLFSVPGPFRTSIGYLGPQKRAAAAPSCRPPVILPYLYGHRPHQPPLMPPHGLQCLLALPQHSKHVLLPEMPSPNTSMAGPLLMALLRWCSPDWPSPCQATTSPHSTHFFRRSSLAFVQSAFLVAATATCPCLLLAVSLCHHKQLLKDWVLTELC